MEMEKKALFLVLLLIILVASLNIISSLLMTVMSRRSEIALMRTLGATKVEIKTIFFRLGLIIGSAGIVAGTLTVAPTVIEGDTPITISVGSVSGTEGYFKSLVKISQI